MKYLFKNKNESSVRFYSRLFPDVFSKGKGSFVYNTKGEKFLDFFCGSGSLNYGHNHPELKQKLIEYINNDGLVNSLDKMTEAKIDFMEEFRRNVLYPRNLNYKMQFCGPTGTNSVEAAIKLARKFTKREKIIYFNNSFHGMTYGSMSISGIKTSSLHEDYSTHTVGVPFGDDEYELNSLREYLNQCTEENFPAAVILETIQAEGGMNVAPKQWLESLNRLAKKHNILLIIDDIQAGCGRTGTFFSFEGINISPDIICLSKSLSGIGLPFSMNLIIPEIDCWKPGEHNGTFRGNNLAFITAACACRYWKTKDFSNSILEKSNLVEKYFDSIDLYQNYRLKGRGLMRGMKLENSEQTMRLQRQLFQNKILVDICGSENNVIKIMPPINISSDDLKIGLERIYKSLQYCCSFIN